MTQRDIATVAILGAGPVGLAAAAHCIERGIEPIVLEAGDDIAAHLRSFHHVRLFSHWRFNIDAAARRLLVKNGWEEPDPDGLPTAGEIVEKYLRPLADSPSIRSALRLRHRVTRIARDGFDKLKSAGREDAPFVIRVATPEGSREIGAWSIVDATGTWATPNPLGSNGLPAEGESEHSSWISYGMPDVLGTERELFSGKRVLVVGAGHSAAGDLLALAALSDESPGTTIVWAVRSRNVEKSFGGGDADQLPARGALGQRLRALRDSGRLEIHTDFRIEALELAGSTLRVSGMKSDGEASIIEGIERIVAATGSRPDLTIASELRVKLDPWIESTEQLAPLIDPNVHSCGTVPPHGHKELTHPEARYYAVGAKSYGRATNFLMATGYEQVRSVVAALAGDLEAADKVELVLPETGVCSSDSSPSGGSCCGTSEAPKEPAKPARIAIPVRAKTSCCA